MLFSRRFALLPALFALLLLPAAHAQSISIYGTASPAYLNHLYNLSGGPSPASDLTGKWFIGAEGGVTLNFSDSNKLAMGLDFRGGPQIGTPGFATALAGFKVASKTSPFHLKPYGQLSVGWMEQRHTTGTGASTVLDAESYFVTELFAGVDYPVTRHLDLRLVEAGIGAGKVVVTNGINTGAHPEIFSLNSGIVYHF
jgi:hypothetical protein